jgi:hypothetical protein
MERAGSAFEPEGLDLLVGRSCQRRGESRSGFEEIERSRSQSNENLRQGEIPLGVGPHSLSPHLIIYLFVKKWLISDDHIRLYQNIMIQLSTFHA